MRRADIGQNLPSNPKRFDTWHCVLGYEGFASGRHYWEVQLGDGRDWAVGVARESVTRKGRIILNPEGGIWALGQWGGQFQALSVPEASLPWRLRVYLDCEVGQVAFYDGDTEALIFTFPLPSFTQERIHPWFWVVEGSQLRLHTRDPVIDHLHLSNDII